MLKEVSLPLQMECTMLFQSNPYMIENIIGLETRLGRKQEDLLPVIEQLLDMGIIQIVGEGNDSLQRLFKYREPEILKEISLEDGLKGI